MNSVQQYARLYCHQNNRYMATGYNAKSRNELAIQYVEYVTNGGGMEKEDEEYIRDCSDARILDLIESNGFTIEWSKEPFEDIEECNQ